MIRLLKLVWRKRKQRRGWKVRKTECCSVLAGVVGKGTFRKI